MDNSLAKLLLSLFTPEEFRRFVRQGPDGEELEAGLPGPSAASIDIIDAAVRTLRRRGTLLELFPRLRVERPRRIAEIVNVEREFEQGLTQSPPSPSQYVLSLKRDGENARDIVVSIGQTLTLGRGPNCEVVLHDRKASTQHAQIMATANGLWIKDLDSKNHTFVDGIRVSYGQISKDQVIRIGQTQLRLMLTPDDKTATETRAD